MYYTLLQKRVQFLCVCCPCKIDPRRTLLPFTDSLRVRRSSKVTPSFERVTEFWRRRTSSVRQVFVFTEKLCFDGPLGKKEKSSSCCLHL